MTDNHDNHNSHDSHEQVRATATRTHDIWLRRDGVIVTQCRQGVHQTVADADATVAAAIAIGGVKRPSLVDMRASFTAANGVRERYDALMSTGEHLAIGVLLGSGVGRAFGNLFLALGRHPTPVRLFTDEEAALTWLRKFRPPPVDLS